MGGYEPDDADQRELVELWHLSRTARPSGDRDARLQWLTDEFLRAHAGEPGVARKWVYVWSEANLGRIAMGAPVGRPSKRKASRSRRPIVADMSWLGPPPPPLTTAEIARDVRDYLKRGK